MAKRLWLLMLIMAVAAAGVAHARTAAAQEPEIRVIRIGTGPTGGSYFPIGGVIANLISSPPGALPCAAGGSCGVPGLIASAVSTQGSTENIAALAAGSLDLALVQADVAYLAYSGEGAFAGEAARDDLRAIASLYAESVHIVTGRDSDIEDIADLRGKRVSLGAERSGTRVSAEMILREFGLDPADLQPVYEGLDRSSDLLADGKIDAFFMVGGYPLATIRHAADVTGIRLLPIEGARAEALHEHFAFFTDAVIPADTYTGVAATPTKNVRANLVVDASMSEDLAFAITRALWLPETAEAMSRDLPETLRIRAEDALAGISIPLHPGAARYYREASLLAADAPRR